MAWSPPASSAAASRRPARPIGVTGGASLVLGCMRGRSVSAAKEGEGRLQGGDAADGDRVKDELDVADAGGGERPQPLGQSRDRGDRLD